MRAETKIIEGVNCRRARFMYYGIAISSSLGCLTLTFVQLWSLPCWEDKDTVISLFMLVALFLFYAILVIRSLCVPIPTVTHRMGERTWSYSTAHLMFFMFMLSEKFHSVIYCIYLFGGFAGGLAVKLLNLPVLDVYIQHAVFVDLMCCVSCYLGYQRPAEPAFYVLLALVALSFVVNHILDKALLPSTDVVHSPSRFRDLDV